MASAAFDTLSAHAEEEDIDLAGFLSLELLLRSWKILDQAREDIGIAAGDLVEKSPGLPHKSSPDEDNEYEDDESDMPLLPLRLLLLRSRPSDILVGRNSSHVIILRHIFLLTIERSAPMNTAQCTTFQLQ